MRDPVYAVRLRWLADGFVGTSVFLTPRLLVRHLVRLHEAGDTVIVVNLWEES